MLTIRRILTDIAQQLQKNNVRNAPTESELLLGFVLKRDRAWLFSHSQEPISTSQTTALARLLKKRIVQRQPLAYIIGLLSFFDIKLYLSPKVLIPRPETEYLVELLRDEIERYGLEKGRFLDVGTGSGAIAIALKKQFPDAEVYGCDISAPALQLAKKNTVFNNTIIQLFESDLLIRSPIGKSFDIIVANLPYVPEGQWHSLAPEITAWEPRDAIVAGADGLKYINQLIEQIPKHLALNGVLALEVWPSHPSILCRRLTQLLPYHKIVIKKDLASRNRFIFAVPD